MTDYEEPDSETTVQAKCPRCTRTGPMMVQAFIADTMTYCLQDRCFYERHDGQGLSFEGDRIPPVGEVGT